MSAQPGHRHFVRCGFSPSCLLVIDYGFIQSHRHEAIVHGNVTGNGLMRAGDLIRTRSSDVPIGAEAAAHRRLLRG